MMYLALIAGIPPFTGGAALIIVVRMAGLICTNTMTRYGTTPVTWSGVRNAEELVFSDGVRNVALT